MSFGIGEIMKFVKTQLLVIDYKSIYNYIIGRSKMDTLYVISSMLHLKVKYHSNEDIVASMKAKL